MCKYLVLTLFQLDPKHRIWQSLQHLRHDFYSLFLCHILSDWSSGSSDKLRIVTWESCFAKPRCDYKLQIITTDFDCSAATLVSTSGPSSVIAMVCSEWALGFPSSVTTVHPSARTLV